MELQTPPQKKKNTLSTDELGFIAPATTTQYRAIGAIAGKLFLADSGRSKIVTTNEEKYSVYISPKFKAWLRKNPHYTDEVRTYVFRVKSFKNKPGITIIGVENYNVEKEHPTTRLGMLLVPQHPSRSISENTATQQELKSGISIRGRLQAWNKKRKTLIVKIERNIKPTPQQLKKQPWNWKPFIVVVKGSIDKPQKDMFLDVRAKLEANNIVAEQIIKVKEHKIKLKSQ